MRVLMTSWDFPPADTGAVAVAVKGLAVALTQAGHEVTLVTVASRRAPAEEVVDGVRVLRANAELPWLPTTTSSPVPRRPTTSSSSSRCWHATGRPT